MTTVLEDPIVEASQLLVYASHTKRITIKGQGLLSAFDPFETPKVKVTVELFFSFSCVFLLLLLLDILANIKEDRIGLSLRSLV